MNASSRLQLRVSPGAGRAEVVGRHGAAWKLRVAAPAEGGRANDAVVRLLAETLSLSRRDIAIVAGLGSRDKVVRVDGIDAAELDARLAAAPATPSSAGRAA